MGSEPGATDQKKRTFIETARRAQLVSTAIEAIAELGYVQASLARIAERAGVSKGVIAYHFDGKDDLVREVVAEVLARAEEFMRPRIEVHSSGPAVLRAYIESNLAFMRAYRSHLVAVVEITRNARRGNGGHRLGVSIRDDGVTATARMLARFQETGEFRDDFDPRIMATAIRAAIDAVPPQLARDPELDIDRYGRELADLFELATRREITSRSSRG